MPKIISPITNCSVKMVWKYVEELNNFIQQQLAVLRLIVSKQWTPECEWINISKFMEMGKLRFCVIIWSSKRLILLCHALQTNDGNHADATTDPHLTCFFKTCSVLFWPHATFCPDFPYMLLNHILQHNNNIHIYIIVWYILLQCNDALYTVSGCIL